MRKRINKCINKRTTSIRRKMKKGLKMRVHKKKQYKKLECTIKLNQLTTTTTTTTETVS